METLNPKMIYRKVGEQRIVVPVGADINAVRCIFTLNETAGFILDRIQLRQDRETISLAFEESYEFESTEQARTVVDETINELKQNQILL